MRRIVMSAVLLAFALSGAAWAQSGGIKSVLEQAATATPDEMREFATESLEIVQRNRTRVKELEEQAEKGGKAGVLTCLRPRVATSKTMVQVTQLAQGKLKAALAASDLDKARHEYRKIAVSSSNSEAIVAEAEQCSEDGGVRGGRVYRVVAGPEDDGQDLIDLRELIEFYAEQHFNNSGDRYNLDIHLDAPNISNVDG